MTIIYRSEKGAPLTSKELDNNFHDLDDRVEGLEKKSIDGEGIDEISLKGDELILKGTRGTLLGKCRFPVITFRAKGLWKKEVLYAVNDVVSTETKALCCIENHESKDLKKDQAYWTVLMEYPGIDALKAQLKEEKILDEEEEEEEERRAGTFLPLYDPQTLPPPSLGQISLVVMDGFPELAISGSDKWLRVRDQEEISEILEEDIENDDDSKGELSDEED